MSDDGETLYEYKTCDKEFSQTIYSRVHPARCVKVPARCPGCEDPLPLPSAAHVAASGAQPVKNDVDTLVTCAAIRGLVATAAADASPAPSAGAPLTPRTSAVEGEPAAAAKNTGSPGLVTPASGGVTQ